MQKHGLIKASNLAYRVDMMRLLSVLDTRWNLTLDIYKHGITKALRFIT